MMNSTIEQTFFNYNQAKCCAQCDKDILEYEMYIQYEYSFYHQNCFKCHFCACTFYNDNQLTQNKAEASLLALNTTPCKSSKNKLYCIDDFIHQNFECKICNMGFKADSEIYPLEGENLVHVNCVACQVCNVKINPNSEYNIQMNANNCQCSIFCKKCTLEMTSKAAAVKVKAKRFEGNKHRLSSRQKEILKNKFSMNKLKADEVISETLILERLAKDMDCSIKSVVQYVSKNKTKLEKQSSHSQKDNVIECMITELKKLDRTLPPNQSPFGIFTKRPTNLLSSMLARQKSSDDIVAPNQCPFKFYPRSVESSPNSM